MSKPATVKSKDVKEPANDYNEKKEDSEKQSDKNDRHVGHATKTKTVKPSQWRHIGVNPDCNCKHDDENTVRSTVSESSQGET